MGDTILGKRFKEIRESLGIKLNEAAGKLGFSSYQILNNIEEGKRDVKASELIKFSQVYYCNISKLLGHEEISADVTFVWRNPPAENKLQVEQDILSRCESYTLLETLLNIKAKKSFIKVSLSDIKTNHKVRMLSSEISDILGLGRRPAFSLQKVLEQDFGIKVLYYPFPAGSSVSTVNEKLGNVIVINSDEAPWRQNFDLAHELFHLITWEAVVERQISLEEGYNEDIEGKANAFASALLLPEDELRNEIIDRAEGSNQISYSDAVDIAIDFGVSTQAFIYRLFHLNCISTFEKADRMAKYVELRQLSNQKRAGEWKERESEQYIALGIRCLRRSLISRGKFAELMSINDRNDIDGFIAERGLVETEGDSIEIMAT